MSKPTDLGTAVTDKATFFDITTNEKKFKPHFYLPLTTANFTV